MDEVLNNIDTYGWLIKEITIDDKFNIIKNLYEFKKATIHGSAYRDELYLIDETKGIHTSWSGWRICDLEPVYKEVEWWNGNFYDKKEVFDGYKTTTNKSLKEYVESHKEECEKWLDEHVDLNKYKEKIKELEKRRKENNSHYYELDSKDKGELLKFYTENNFSNGYASIESTKHGFNIEFDDIVLGGEEESPLQSILLFMFYNRNLFKDFIKLNKGYVFNNDYYESIKDIIEHIEDCIKEKNLYIKFMNEGLNAEDLVIDNEDGR